MKDTFSQRDCYHRLQVTCHQGSTAWSRPLFIVLSLLMLILTGTSLRGQDQVELFGYFESQLSGAEVKGNFYQINANKLRIDLKSGFSEKITFTANYDYILYYGKTTWNILDFLSPDIVSSVPQTMSQFYVLRFADRSFLDNAYLKLAFKYFDLIAGKQQVSLGTGYVWNPLDVFNIKDVLDPTYEQPGHNALRFDVPIGSDYTISALYSPEDTWRNSAKMLRFKGRISRFDYTLVGIETRWQFHDYTQFDAAKANFLEMPEKRQVLGGSLAGELLGLGVWAEYGHNRMERSKDFYELVLGTDYTFDFQSSLMVEYYRNTLGKTNEKEYTLNDWMRLFTAEQKTVSRDQVYVLVRHPATDLIETGISGICSISDKSFAIVPSLNYSLWENVDAIAYLNVNLGSRGTAYDRKSGNGGLLRLRVYF